MHQALCRLSSVAIVATAAVFAAGYVQAAGSEKLTIVYDFQGPHSSRSISEMQQEVAGILSDSGLKLEWRALDRTSATTDAGDNENLVVVHFNGRCILEPVPILYDERGPLAFTHTSDGAVLPFSEVACDQVTASMRSAMFGGDYAQADQLLGRALGRVVAHELVHMLTKSHDHGREGVAKAALSGTQLIEPRLPLSASDLERLRNEHRR
jgi:hypothetical protein